MFLVSPVRKRRQTSWGLQHDVSFEPPYPDMFIDAIFMSMLEIGLHVVAAAVQSQLVALYERSPSMSPTGQDVHSSDETFVAVQHARGCLQHSTSNFILDIIVSIFLLQVAKRRKMLRQEGR